MVLRATRQSTDVLITSTTDGTLRVSLQVIEALVPVAGVILDAADNTLNFAQVADAVIEKPGAVNSAITFTQNLSFVHFHVFNEATDSTLALTQNVAWSGPNYASILSKLNLSHAANAVQGTPWEPVEFEDVLTFVQRVNLALPAVAENTLNFSDETYRLQTPTSNLAFIQTTDNGKSKDVDSSAMALTQNVATSNEFVRVMEATNFIGHSLTYYVESPCSTKAYTPFIGENTIPNAPAPPDDEEPIVQADPTNTRFQLSYPALATPTDTVELRAPELDNIDRLSFTRINRETRGGKLSVFADPAWPKTETIIATFVGLTRTEIETLQTFFVDHIGEEVGMQDWEGREWVGVVTTPNESAVNDGGRNACGDKGWTITFEFEGVLVDGYAPNNSLSLTQNISTVVVGP
jgi:hypothetical protein